MSDCSIADCDRPAKARGWCKLHYYRWSRTGDPTATKRPGLGKSSSYRFWLKVVESPTGCWLWTDSLSPKGYGKFWHDGTMMGAHIFAYRDMVGEVPEGLELDHTCRVRHCVRPDHLDPVTHAVNVARGGNTTKTHCKRSHEFTEANTYITTTGGRQCRACEASRRAERQQVAA